MKYKKIVLKNGLRIIHVPVKGNPAVTVMVLVETGSNYETRSQNGLSHFLEHMMFKGTSRRPSPQIINTEFDALGAQSNAFTSHEVTGYWAKAEKKNFKKLVDILADMYLNPLLPKEELEKERGVILQEISMYEDEPRRQIRYVINKLMYGDAPAGRTILGPAKNIKKFSRKDFENYRNEHYVAKKTIVVVAGDLDMAEVRSEIAENFKNISKNKKVGKESVKINQKAPAILIHQKSTDQMHMVMGFHAFEAKDKRSVALAVLVGVLGQGMSSRLFHKLRDEMGVCYYVRGGLDENTDHGSVTIATGIDGKRVEEVVRALIKECHRLKDELVPSKELKKTKDYLIGNLYMGLETTDSLADFYLEQEVTKGNSDTPERVEKDIRAVTAEDVRRVAREIFRKEKLNLAIIGKVKNPSRLKKLLVI